AAPRRSMSKHTAEPMLAAPTRMSLTRTAAWLEAHAGLAIGGFVVVYALGTGALAWRKPLGNDEIFTYLIARAASLGDLWRALESGAEHTPPLSHLLTRGSFGVSRMGHRALRAPALVCFVVV